MKKIVFLLLTVAVLQAQAQKARFNAYGGYLFDDKVDIYADNNSYFQGTLKGGFQWGAGVEFRLENNYGIELLYLNQNTTAPMEYYDVLPKETEFNVNMNYVMLGGVKSIRKPGSKAEPYGGLMLGANFVSVENPDKDTKENFTKFAWGLRGGVNIWASEKVGIKLQALLLSSVESVGGSLYLGTGGAGAGVSTYSSVLQFGLGGGLTFNIGK